MQVAEEDDLLSVLPKILHEIDHLSQLTPGRYVLQYADSYHDLAFQRFLYLLIVGLLVSSQIIHQVTLGVLVFLAVGDLAGHDLPYLVG